MHRDFTKLNPQLIGLEGWRVRVETLEGEKRSFIVGISTGWQPIHLEIKTKRSLGGDPCEHYYKSIEKMYQAR